MKWYQDESFMRNFRWITPLAVSVCAIAITILIAVQGYLVFEIRDTKKSAIAYTDKMVQMISTHGHADLVTKSELKDVKEDIGTIKDKVTEIDKKIVSVKTLLMRKVID